MRTCKNSSLSLWPLWGRRASSQIQTSSQELPRHIVREHTDGFTLNFKFCSCFHSQKFRDVDYQSPYCPHTPPPIHYLCSFILPLSAGSMITPGEMVAHRGSFAEHEEWVTCLHTLPWDWVHECVSSCEHPGSNRLLEEFMQAAQGVGSMGDVRVMCTQCERRKILEPDWRKPAPPTAKTAEHFFFSSWGVFCYVAGWLGHYQRQI